MKAESIKQAYAYIDKYNLNEEALKELKKITTNGVDVTLPNETLSDRVINMLDKRRVILNKKSDILNKFYSNTTVAKDIVLDNQSETFAIRSLRNAVVAGLIGYNTYYSIVNRTPFMKLPGLVVSLAAIHAIERKLSNDIIEKRLNTPWKIHTYRLSKGLGPTNYQGYIDPEQYNNRLSQDNRYSHQNMYLHQDNLPFHSYGKDIYYNKDIYFLEQYASPITNKQFIDKYIYPNIVEDPNEKKTSNRYSVRKNDTEFDNSYEENKDKNHDSESKKDNLAMLKLKEEGYKRRVNLFRNYVRYNDGWLSPDTNVSYDTFDANSGNEVDLTNNRINYTNEYDNVLEFAQSKTARPAYTSTLFNHVFNLNTTDIVKATIDIALNQNLKDLKRKIHNLRKFGVSDDEVSKIIREFNDNAKATLKTYLEENNNNVVRNEAPQESYLIHSEKEEAHLRKFFEFTQKNKIVFEKEEEGDYYDEFVNEESYDPWVEYKNAFADLFKKGRKYFIVESIPEWKFLQIRQPKVVEDNHSEFSINQPNFRDSFFNIVSLERWFIEKDRKPSLYGSESVSHRI